MQENCLAGNGILSGNFYLPKAAGTFTPASSPEEEQATSLGRLLLCSFSFLLFDLLGLDFVRITQQLFTFGRAAAISALKAHRLVHGIADVAIRIGAAIIVFTCDFFRLAEMLFVFSYHAAIAAFI
jgi:hypothetical protein